MNLWFGFLDPCCVDDCGRPISRGPQGTGDCEHYTICCAGKLILKFHKIK